MPARRIAATGLCLLAGLAAPLRAHGDLHERIEEATRRIAREPGRADLHLHRAELHRHHRDPAAARADLDRAAVLDPSLAAVDLARGRLELEAGDAARALRALDRHVGRDPASGEGRIERARALARLGRHGEAAAEFERAMDRLAEPRPDHFLEWAGALAAREPGAAVAALEAGMRRLGPIVSLQLPAIDADLEAGRVEAALGRIDRLQATVARADRWEALRGDVLARAGRRDEARAAFREALRALEALPPHRRFAPAIAGLERRARAALEDGRDRR